MNLLKISQLVKEPGSKPRSASLQSLRSFHNLLFSELIWVLQKVEFLQKWKDSLISSLGSDLQFLRRKEGRQWEQRLHLTRFPMRHPSDIMCMQLISGRPCLARLHPSGPTPWKETHPLRQGCQSLLPRHRRSQRLCEFQARLQSLVPRGKWLEAS